MVYEKSEGGIGKINVGNQRWRVQAVIWWRSFNQDVECMFHYACIAYLLCEFLDSLFRIQSSVINNCAVTWCSDFTFC